MGKNWQKYQFFGQTYEKTIRGWGLIQKNVIFIKCMAFDFAPMGAYLRVGAYLQKGNFTWGLIREGGLFKGGG